MRSTLLGYALLAPSLFGVVCFLLLPMLVVVWLSLHRWDLLGPIRYVGLDNWHSVLTDPSFGNSLLVTLLFIAIVVPAQIVLGLVAAALLARGLPGSGVLPHPVRAAVDLLAAGGRGAVALDPGPHRRCGQHAAGPPDRVADRPGSGTAGGLGGDGVDQRRLRDAVLPGRASWRSRRRSTPPPALDGATALAAVLAHHAADAAPDAVLRLGHRHRQRGAGVRHRVRADRRRSAGPHRPGGAPHLRRGVRRRSDRAGRGDGDGAVRHPGRCDDRPALYFRRRISYDLT